MKLINANMFLKVAHGIKEFDDALDPITEELIEQIIEEQPTVEAIPIELIKKEMKQLDEDIKWAWYYGNVALDKMEYLKTWLTIKLEDWEKENGSN